jgi:hypothetical protein
VKFPAPRLLLAPCVATHTAQTPDEAAKLDGGVTMSLRIDVAREGA